MLPGRTQGERPLPAVDMALAALATYVSTLRETPSRALRSLDEETEDTIGSQYISDKLILGGNGTFNVNWDPTLVPGIRQVWLVE
jgi:hypothetical protein